VQLGSHTAVGASRHTFVQVPNIIAGRLLATWSDSVVRPELLCSVADRFVGDNDPTLLQQFFDQAQAQWEPEIEPDRVRDNLGWETMALVADGRGHTSASIPQVLILCLCDKPAAIYANRARLLELYLHLPLFEVAFDAPVRAKWYSPKF
jgi:hypothetical protein